SIGDISAIRVFEYRPPPAAQLRVDRTEVETQLIKKALQLRQEYQLPFWDSLLLSCFSCDEVPHSILNSARFHVSHRDSEREVQRSGILQGALQNLAEGL